MTDTETSTADEQHPIPDTDGDEWIDISDLKVTQTRIILRKRACDRHGIGEKDTMLDTVVLPYDDEAADPIYVRKARVGGQQRILLPRHRVVDANLDGQEVQIAVRKAGKVAL